MIGYYDGWETASGIPVDEKVTLSENIADIAGKAAALQVLSSKENPDYERFFNSYAKSWVKAATREDVKNVAYADVHAPYNLRTNRVVVNFQEFYDTFGIKDGNGMYVAPEDRISIW